MKLLALVLATGFLGSANAQELELKGMKPGDPMDACPSGARLVASRTAETLCGLGATTLANQEATDHLVSFYDGKVIAVMYSLKDKGRYANALVLEALKAKYGEPSIAKPHINDYAWTRGQSVLSLNGYAGTVMLIDRALAQQARDAGAQKSKGDI